MASKTPVFLWSDCGSTLFLARRLKREGHPVLLYIKDPAAQSVGQGLVPKTTSPVPPKGSLVIFDGIGHGSIGKELRRRGHAVIGGNPLDRALEADRPEGARIMREHGIPTPVAHEFRSIPTAIKFLDGQEGHWFVKAIGADQPEASTFDAPVEMLQRYLRSLDGVEHFQLSRKVEGTELSTNGWFDGTRFVPPFDCTLEEKRFLAGNLGPRTGCESNLVWTESSEALPDMTVSRIEGLLGQEGYVGPVDLNALFDAHGAPKGLEWTARLGFDATQAWSHLIPGTLGEQLVAFAHGELQKWDVADDLSVTLRVTMPPYPLWEPRVAQKSQGRPLDPRWLTDPDVTVEDVQQGPEGPQMAGRDGLIGTVGATGERLSDLVTDVLTQAQALFVPNKQYRIDPVSRAEKDLRTLVGLGLVGHPALERQFGGKQVAA